MKNQRIVVALTAVNLVLLLVGAARARSPDPQATSVLRGRSLELLDENGRVRSRLNVESNGEVVFRLLDQDGTIRVKLGAAKDGSGLVLLNDSTEPGVHILAKAGGSSVKVRNKDGQERIVTP